MIGQEHVGGVPRESWPPAPTVSRKISSKNPYTRQGNALGLTNKIMFQALKGRQMSAGHRCCAPSGLESVRLIRVPGRCPGLSSCAPLGRKNPVLSDAHSTSVTLNVSPHSPPRMRAGEPGAGFSEASDFLDVEALEQVPSDDGGQGGIVPPRADHAECPCHSNRFRANAFPESTLLRQGYEGHSSLRFTFQWLAIRSFRHGSEEWRSGWERRHKALIIQLVTAG
jgi:hypothetical protein